MLAQMNAPEASASSPSRIRVAATKTRINTRAAGTPETTKPADDRESSPKVVLGAMSRHAYRAAQRRLYRRALAVVGSAKVADADG